MKIVLTILLAIVALVLAFVLWPSPIDSVAWTPPSSPGFAGPYAGNDQLDGAEVYPVVGGVGPEDVAMDDSGRLYGGLQDGRIVRWREDGQQETFVTLEGGRPLGMHFDDADNLVVADAFLGLLSVDPMGVVTVLSTEAGGKPYAFPDDLDIASDGRIYFSDASDKYDQHHWRFDLFEARPRGRLMRFDPVTGKVEVLLEGLYFANGVALSEHEDFVLVNETGRYRVRRYWLAGDKAGSDDIFIDNLPGFPDGISSNRQGTFWLAIPSPRVKAMDDIHPTPWLKNLITKLPDSLSVQPIRRGVVIGLNEAGEVIHNLQDEDGAQVWMITSVQEEGGYLYLGSLEAPQAARIMVPGQ